MCKQGTVTEIRINGELVSIDSCIALIVSALNHHGIRTVASCCGHGKRPGNIVLEDGRELFITKDFKESRKLDKLIEQI